MSSSDPSHSPDELIDLTTSPLSRPKPPPVPFLQRQPEPSVAPPITPQPVPPDVDLSSLPPELAERVEIELRALREASAQTSAPAAWQAKTIVTGSGLGRRVTHHVTDPSGVERTYEDIHDVPEPARTMLLSDDAKTLWLREPPPSADGEPHHWWLPKLMTLKNLLIGFGVILLLMYSLVRLMLGRPF